MVTCSSYFSRLTLDRHESYWLSCRLVTDCECRTNIILSVFVTFYVAHNRPNKCTHMQVYSLPVTHMDWQPLHTFRFLASWKYAFIIKVAHTWRSQSYIVAAITSSHIGAIIIKKGWVSGHSSKYLVWNKFLKKKWWIYRGIPIESHFEAAYEKYPIHTYGFGSSKHSFSPWPFTECT